MSQNGVANLQMIIQAMAEINDAFARTLSIRSGSNHTAPPGRPHPGTFRRPTLHRLDGTAAPIQGQIPTQTRRPFPSTPPKTRAVAVLGVCCGRSRRCGGGRGGGGKFIFVCSLVTHCTHHRSCGHTALGTVHHVLHAMCYNIPARSGDYDQPVSPGSSGDPSSIDGSGSDNRRRVPVAHQQGQPSRDRGVRHHLAGSASVCQLVEAGPDDQTAGAVQKDPGKHVQVAASGDTRSPPSSQQSFVDRDDSSRPVVVGGRLSSERMTGLVCLLLHRNAPFLTPAPWETKEKESGSKWD